MVWDHEVAGSNPATPTIIIDGRDAAIGPDAAGSPGGNSMGRLILYFLASIGFITLSVVGVAATAVVILWLQDRQWQMNAAKNRQMQNEQD